VQMGRNSGLRVSQLTLGTMNFGQPGRGHQGDWTLGPDEARPIFEAAIDRGLFTFDCADIYLGVEEIIGRFRRGLSDPDSIQVHTKFAPDRDTLSQLSERDIDRVIDRSLQRLGVEQLDLLQFHWWNYETPGLEKMLGCLSRAQAAGKIRLLGATNFDTAHIEDMLDAGTNLVSLQTQYSLLDRRPIRRMSAVAEARNVALLPYGVLAGGFLSERYLDVESPLHMNRSLQKYRLIIDEAGGWPLFQELLRTLSGIAGKHDCSIAQIAARWVLDQPCVAAIILGTGKQSRAQENTALQNLRLDDEDCGRIAGQLEKQDVPPGDMYALERDQGGRHAGIIKMNLQNADDGALR